MQLLVSTPNFLLEHDTASRLTNVLDSGRGEYYGLSWDLSGSSFAASHSFLENHNLRDLADYANSERGTVSVAGFDVLHFLSAPHQILWVDAQRLVVTNTGRNTIICFDVKSGLSLQRRVGSVLWDRLSSESYDGVHLNSLFFKNGTLYVLANNFTKGSFVCEFSWPDLKLTATHITPNLSGLHNLFVAEDGQWITCDSHSGALADARSGERLWSNGGQGITRGLAASRDLFFVGHSESSGRSLRTGTESGIWVVNRATLKTIDYIYLGHFGCVNEVRIGSEPDLAHHGHPLKTEALHHLVEKRRTLTKARLERGAQVHAIIGTFDFLADYIMAREGGFLLGVLPSPDQATTGVSARIHFGIADTPVSSHAALVVRYHGPGDQNMVAAIFQQEHGTISVGFWTNLGAGWKQHSSAFIKPDMLETFDGRPTLKASLNERKGAIYLSVKGQELLSLTSKTPLPAAGGLPGIRLHGANIAISSLMPERG